MDLTRLAAKQKRCKEIREFAQREIRDTHIQKALLDTLSTYQHALTKSWTTQGSTPENDMSLDSIERDLERLHNEARLSAGTR